MRQVPSGFRAKTTEASRSRVLDPAPFEQVDELRAQLSKLSVRQALHWARSLHRCITCLELELHTSVLWKAWRGPPPNTPAYLLLMAVNGGSSAPARCSAETERGKAEVQLGAVFQHFHSVGKTSCRRLFGGSPGSASSTCSLTVRRLQRSQVELTRRGPRPLAGTIPTNDSGTPGRQPESQPPLPVRAPPYR